MRVGQAFDVHPFVSNRRLILGGVEIPYEYGLAGHSDADVVLHVIGDALLGAAGLGDMGRYFPDTDQKFKDISSGLLLKQVIARLKDYKILNVDITIIAERPKLLPYFDRITESVAALLALPIGDVNVKAKTCEKMGFIGRGEGIAAMAVVLINERYHGTNA